MGNFFSTPPTPIDKKGLTYKIDKKGLTYKRLKQTHFNDKGFISIRKENGKYSSKMEDVFNFYSSPKQIKWFINENIQLYVDREHLDEKRIAEDEATLTPEQKEWVHKFKQKEEKLYKNYLSERLKKISEQKAARRQNLETNRAQNRIAKVTRKTTYAQNYRQTKSQAQTQILIRIKSKIINDKKYAQTQILI